MRPLIIFVPLIALAQNPSGQGPSPQGMEFFESRIRPVLAKNCYGCHSSQAKGSSAGLMLDLRDTMRSGGSSGPAIVPGNSAASLLMRALRQEGPKMPPTGKLPDEVIADFARWIDMGAPDPRLGEPGQQVMTTWKTSIDVKKGREFWAFQPPKKTPPPKIASTWAKTDIDRFIAAGLQKKGLTPAPDASKHALIRRAWYDLTGLPPTPEEVAAFVADKSPGAFAKVVDKLLASPQFGETWGRHWLDIARYAESNGRTRNYTFPFAWRYRDWVINAVNQDKPYDQFIREQIAGDLLPSNGEEQRRRQLIATGFLAIGAHDLNEVDPLQFQMDVVDEQINVVSRSMLGLTVGCARCHDHKFDPIPTTDYYALAGIFRSTSLKTGLQRRPRNNVGYFQPELLMPLPDSEKKSLTPEQAQRRDQLMEQRQQSERVLLRQQKQKNVQRIQQARQTLARIEREIGQFPLPNDFAMGALDGTQVGDCKVNLRGDQRTFGPSVPRGVVGVLTAEGIEVSIPSGSSGRLQLAEWLTRPDHPLTSRVMVNRIWHHLFGRGIVRTVDNFGVMGEKPAHPELLDYLATRFSSQGWSVKRTIREIMLSRVYQLSSEHVARDYAVDPDNTMLWRMNRRRLDVEAIRDSLLAVSGKLDLAPVQASPVLNMPRGNPLNPRQVTPDSYENTLNCRSVYVPVLRAFVPSMFEVFDFPEPSETKGSRDTTTVAPQALFFMNSPFVLDQTRAAADELLKSAKKDADRVARLYQQVLSRAPTSREIDQALTFVGSSADRDAWARLYQSLFASAEFLNRT